MPSTEKKSKNISSNPRRKKFEEPKKKVIRKSPHTSRHFACENDRDCRKSSIEIYARIRGKRYLEKSPERDA